MTYEDKDWPSTATPHGQTIRLAGALGRVRYGRWIALAILLAGLLLAVVVFAVIFTSG